MDGTSEELAFAEKYEPAGGDNPFEVALEARRTRVLLAEPDPALRRILADGLRRDGHDVVAVENGITLAGHAGFSNENEIPDLVIASLGLPGLEAWEVKVLLRDVATAAPVIVLAPRPDATDFDLVALGAATVFTPPFDLDDIRIAVDVLIDVRPPGLRGQSPSPVWK